MGVERVDYYSEEEYQQALLFERQEMEQYEPDQVDIMSEDELRNELKKALATIEAQKAGEFICSKCGVRQDNDAQEDIDDVPF